MDTKQSSAWLFKIDRKTAGLISKVELTDGALIHPGGLQYDGRYIWVPNAEYKRQSRTMVYGLDPDTLEIRTSFPVDDHIGAVASDGKNFFMELIGMPFISIHGTLTDVSSIKSIPRPQWPIRTSNILPVNFCVAAIRTEFAL